MILGNKIFIFYFYGINPAQAENPISFLLSFRDPNDVQMTCKFTSANIWKKEDLGVKEANRRRPEGQKRWAHAAPVPSHVGPPNLGLDAPLPSIFPPPTPF